jgi:hypothetical protein
VTRSRPTLPHGGRPAGRALPVPGEGRGAYALATPITSGTIRRLVDAAAPPCGGPIHRSARECRWGRLCRRPTTGTARRAQGAAAMAGSRGPGMTQAAPGKSTAARAVTDYTANLARRAAATGDGGAPRSRQAVAFAPPGGASPGGRHWPGGPARPPRGARGVEAFCTDRAMATAARNRRSSRRAAPIPRSPRAG